MLKVCISLRVLIHIITTAQQQDHCRQKVFVTSPKEKEALVSTPMNLLKSWENATEMLSETHRQLNRVLNSPLQKAPVYL